EEANEIYKNGFYGKPLGVTKPRGQFDSPLVMDFIECMYLLEKGIIDIYSGGKLVKAEELRGIFEAKYDRFDDKYSVYRALRDMGLVVIPGMKFGGDFAVYRKGPGLEHAPYIVNVVKGGHQLGASELVLAGRLARSVRKRFIIAVPGKQPTLLGFDWWKP
ncbi:MAG: tRNA-intron lyase, partial [Nitrososphaerota archaeon]|nr:tRNA-intron lyase [Nitrososphaerota archaeon]